MSDQDEKILSAAKDWKVPESRSKEEVWSALEEQIREKGHKRSAFSVPYTWIAAASFLLFAIAGALFLLFFQSTVIETGLAEVKAVTLPDGSEVVLNANSRMSYSASSFEQNRQLDFEGEAYFEVKPGNSFTIDLDGVEITVLGTSFNIYARAEIKEVKCLTGKVEVSDDHRSVVLEPGLSVLANHDELESVTSVFKASEAISWQEGKFLFTNAPLTRVVNELEIQYGVTVEAGELKNRFYTGYFDNTDLEKAVKQIFSPMGYSYEISDKKIVITWSP